MKTLFIYRKERLPLKIGLIFFLCFIPVYDLIAAEIDTSKGPVTIEADSISYDQNVDTYYAKGSVVITYSGGLLMAESVSLNKASNEATAEGFVMIISDNDILEGDKVEFNIESKTGVAYEGKMFLERNHFYISGSRIEKKGEATYNIKDATATTCDGDSPDWRLTGRELDVTMEGYGTLKHGEFLAKNIPIFYAPYLLFPAKTNRQSGFLFPYLNYSENKLGWDIEIPFYWAISENTDATFYQRFMDKRGFKEGIEFRYFIGNNSFGTVYGDFMNDAWRVNETAGNASRDWQSDHKRWSYYLNHETTFDPSFYLRTDIRKVSDAWYFRDFSSHNYYLDNYSTSEAQRFRKVPFVGDESLGSLDSTARLVKNWQLYNLTALVRYTDDFASASNDLTLQKYPEITLKGIKRPIFGTPLNLEFDATYDYFYTNEGQKGHLYDVQPVLTMPLRMGDYLKLTPQIGVKETLWDRNDNLDTSQNKHDNRIIYTTGAHATTEIHRIFNIGGQEIEKIRHGIQPELTYTYIPNVNQDNVPSFATVIPDQNTLTYALTNTLVAKSKEKGGGGSYLELLRLKLSQTYDFNEAKRGDKFDPATGALIDKRPFSDVDIELDVKPVKYLSFSARNKYNLYSNGWDQTNYDLNMSDWRGDTATVGYRYTSARFSTISGINASASNIAFYPYLYTAAPLEEINLSIKAVITKSVDLLYVLRQDQFNNNAVENTIGFNYHKQCWSIEVKYSESFNDKSFTVAFSLYGLGKFGGQ